MEASEVPSRWAELVQRVRDGESISVQQDGREVVRMNRGEDEAMAKLRKLEAEGKIRIPPRFGEYWTPEPVSAIDGGYVGALDALLEERESDR